MNINQVIKNPIFPYGNINEGDKVQFKFDFVEGFDFNQIDYMWDSNVNGCSCFKWNVDETARTITGTMDTARNIMGVMPKVGWNQKMNEIFIKLKTTPNQYEQANPSNGKRTFKRQESANWKRSLLSLKVDGYINREK